MYTTNLPNNNIITGNHAVEVEIRHSESTDDKILFNAFNPMQHTFF